MIGPYRLLEHIGEGRFGVVFMAEQMEPVRRKVALKILKPGMATLENVARFEAERQALALMDHPNIVRVFDGGSTEASVEPSGRRDDATQPRRADASTLAGGRPYFVMELIEGLPITQYCDDNRLAPRERLKLFVQVCRAVQHVHQKAIIYRDLKPSDILVTARDTTPVVKLLDFGFAKATGGQITDKTLFIRSPQMIGTPPYMSPEQAGDRLDIDTRSDIYCLGVLLYELLVGTTPFDKDRFRQATSEEIRRIIEEEEPPKPSTRLSTEKELGSIAANRSLPPAKLTKLLRDELDCIVMKCLEKDRNGRYGTASDLGQEIERYLWDQPR